MVVSVLLGCSEWLLVGCYGVLMVRVLLGCSEWLLVHC